MTYGWTSDGSRTVFRKLERSREKRSALPRPCVINDTMPPTEQVDGKFYTSKSAFRSVGRSLGLIEVGNEKLPQRQQARPDPKAIKDSVENAIARLKR